MLQMQTVLRKFFFVVAAITSLSILHINGLGQYDSLCKRIEHSVEASTTGSRLFRSDAASYGCNLEFSVPDLRIAVESSGSMKKSREDFYRTVQLYRINRVNGPLFPIQKLQLYGTWDEAVLISSRSNSSEATVIRYKKWVITVLSVDRETMFRIEKELRNIFANEVLDPTQSQSYPL